MTSRTAMNKFSPEVRERAVRMVLEHEAEHASRWAALASISATTGAPGEMAQRLKALERENREFRHANEILRKASTYFTQAELDRRFKP